MNILCINHEYPPIGGGGGTACKYTSREYAALGHGVTVVTAAFENTPQFETLDGIDIYRLKCKRLYKDHSSFFEMLSFLFAAFRFLPKLMKKSKFNAVHIFFGIPSGPLGWYAKKRYRIPYVVSLAGGDVPGTQKRFKVVYAILNPFIRAIGRNAAYVVANSSKLLERAKKFYGRANYKVIPYGANVSEFPIEKTHRADSELYMVTTARIEERKGIQHVIEALPLIVSETGGRIRYTIIGDGVYRETIEALTEKFGVSQYVEITGMVPYKDVLRRLSEADVFILTSYWEGMPSAVLEAMASHLPIIMTNCEGSAELVDRNGYIIDMSENIPTRLAEKIMTLYNDRELLAKMGRESYRRICEEFTWENAANAYIRLFE